MGLTPEYWGPYVWASIHLVCLGAPETLDAAQQQAYRSFFQQLPYVIPCASCARHLQENLAKVPLEDALAGRDDLFAWSVRLHNLVNTQLKKQTLEVAAARKHWETICVSQGPSACIRDGKKHGGIIHPSLQKVMYVVLGASLGALFMAGYHRLKRDRT